MCRIDEFWNIHETFPHFFQNKRTQKQMTQTNQLFSSFRRVEISSFRRFEISRQTNAKADDSTFCQDVQVTITTIFLSFNRFRFCGKLGNSLVYRQNCWISFLLLFCFDFLIWSKLHWVFRKIFVWHYHQKFSDPFWQFSRTFLRQVNTV